MDWLAGPVVPGAMMMCAALAAWALGRWQDRLSERALAAPTSAAAGDPVANAPAISPQVAAEHPVAIAPAPMIPCQHAARAERRLALAAASADPLSELHAEISAYRRAEQVLAAIDADDLLGQRHSEIAACRYLGRLGEPTCGIAPAARAASACRCCESAAGLPRLATALRAAQPSARAADGMRL